MSWDEILKGTNGSDTINGGSGDDYLQGRAGGDFLDGGSGDDQIHGDSGDDHVRGGTGNDLLTGGTGIDTAYYSGSIFEYAYSTDGTNWFINHTGGTQADGNDRLLHFERLVFADATIDLSQNNAPIAFADSATTHEDVGTYSSGSARVTDNDFDWEKGNLAVTPGTFTGAYGTLVLNANGTYTYTPHASSQALAQGQTVQDVFTYTVSDGSLSSTGTLTVNLAGRNDAPTANPDSATGHENQVVTVDVLANDADVDHGAVLSVTAASAPAGKGSASVVGNQVQFDPGTAFDHLAQGASEQVVITYTVKDEHGATSSSTVTVTVTGTNDGPVANADAAATDENAAVAIAVLANDTDADDGAVLTVTAASAPAGKGSAAVSNNQVVFDPGSDFDHLAAGATEQVVVSYTMTDEHGATSNSTVTVTVTGTNDGPVANADAAATDENGTVAIAVLSNDSDVDDGAVLAVTAASAPAGKGSVSVAGNQLVFDPESDFDHLAAGAAEIVVLSYTVEDEHGASASSTVTVTVTGTNDGPVANADSAATDENSAIAIAVLANDTDADDGAVLTVTAASAPAGKGMASVSGNQVTFDPGSDFDHLAAGVSEIVLVAYSIQDEHGATSSSTVSVTVTGTNDGPVANADTAATGENSAVTIDVLANDTDADDGAVLTLTGASLPAGQGSVSVVGGQLAYDPGSAFDHLSAGETASVVISYTVEDEHGASAGSTATVTVNGANDAVTIDAANSSVTGSVSELPDNAPGENSHVHQASGAVAFDDVDTGDVHSAAASPQGGSYLGTFTLDPVDQAGDSVGWNFSVSDAALNGLAAGQVVTQTYTITIDDGHGGAATQDVTVTLTGTGDNSPPTAADDSYSALGNVTLTVSAGAGVLANDSDDAGMGSGAGQTPVTAYDAVSANGGKVAMNPDGSFSYTSKAGFNGTDTFTYTVTDADGASDTATVTVNVGQSVWFVDNAAAGSANLGTQADPYTSIAAFNAAQGTANGPAAGETIYVRKGTGTYAEADGFNLLSGQTLIGGGQDLVVGGSTIETGTGRPTIVTTGGTNHGVELSTNNTVKGIDIGTTTGAGISDGNGSVGTLVVSDVAKSGSGQVIDVDQGGTINVTLNSAVSTGSTSTSSTIDLTGLSGTFTVLGATTITGSHANGAVRILNSTAAGLDASFLGKLTVAIGSTGVGVGFNNNGAASSLSITGGLSITAGIGLRAVSGGDITISGDDNVIVATSSVAALNLTNVNSLGVTLESVSAGSGSSTAITLDNAGSGGISITGNGSVAGSGGTIANRGGQDGSTSSGNGVYINNTANVSLANMVISGNANYGILGTNVQNFTLRDSTVGANGSNSGEASVSFTNLTGTALFEGNTISGGTGDNLRIVNTAGALDLTLRDSASDQAVMGLNNVNGNDNVFVRTSGTATLEMLVDGVSFLGARGDQLHVVAEGNSSHDLTVRNSSFTNTHTNTLSGGGGIFLSGGGGGSDIDVDYVIADNVVQGADGAAIAVVYAPSAGTIRGHIDGNRIGLADGVAGTQGSSGGGSGILVALEKQGVAGTATHTVTIEDNRIYDIAFGLGGIELRSNGGVMPNQAVLEATVRNNVVDELGDGTASALWATVGGNGPGDYAELGLNLSNNVLDAGDADFGLNAIYLDQVSPDAHFYFPGYAGSGDGEYNGGNASADLHAYFAGKGNVMTNGGFPSFVGGVDAGSIIDATGDIFVYPVWP